ncbi:hypothetical protein M8Z33_00395 [Streptomyces sp. ZAF1911]|uniref:hypothetical protein n=1 Tax=Streptomyces sp. ZAF1911 TaxID=2944129 RepID=UPI00237BAE75|nr:hypothetical protein [Streptomyces sp. ZAF1911]MDD9375153.1 hypothetical protein [Streptomyces sp. ZAF1911]
MRRRAQPPSPLTQRAGIDPVRLRLPPDPEGSWPDLGDYLPAHYAGGAGAEAIARLLDAGRMLGPGGPHDPPLRSPGASVNRPAGSLTSQPLSAIRAAFDRTPSTFADTRSRPSTEAISPQVDAASAAARALTI